MKKILLIAGVLALGIATQAIAAVQKPVLKVGVIVPLSGNFAFIGEDIRNGFILGQEQKKSASCDIEYIYEDSQLELRLAAVAAQKLINVDKVDVLVSLWDTADVVAPIAEKAKKLHVSFRWDPQIAKDFSYTFTLECTYMMSMDMQIRLWEKLGAKRIAIIRDKVKSMVLCSEYLKKQKLPDGMKVVFEEAHAEDLKDFRTILSKARQADPDLYVLMNFLPALEISAKQLREMDPHAKMTGNFELLVNPSQMEGCYFVNDVAATEEFQKQFEKRFGGPFKIRAPHAYDMHQLLLKCVENAGVDAKPTNEMIIAELMKIQNFPGALGPLTVEPTRNIRSLPVVQLVKDGKATTVEMDKIGPVLNYY